MEVFNDTLMHLGATTKETIDMLNYINNKCKIGISFYLQTKIKDKTKSLDKMLNYINNKFSNYKLNFVSIAGIKQSNKLNHLLITKIKKSLNLDYIILEPGKYLVGDCVDMITKVIRKKVINNKNILIIKNGIYSGLLDVILYKEKFKLYLINNNNKLIDFSYKKDDNHDLLVNVCGGSSDSGDVIGSMYINSN